MGFISAGLLLFQFLSEGGNPTSLNFSNSDAAFYTMVANIFEIIFFSDF